MNHTLFSFYLDRKKGSGVIPLPYSLFVLPDPQILGMLIGMDEVERLVNS